MKNIKIVLSMLIILCTIGSIASAQPSDVDWSVEDMLASIVEGSVDMGMHSSLNQVLLLDNRMLDFSSEGYLDCYGAEKVDVTLNLLFSIYDENGRESSKRFIVSQEIPLSKFNTFMMHFESNLDGSLDDFDALDYDVEWTWEISGPDDIDKYLEVTMSPDDLEDRDFIDELVDKLSKFNLDDDTTEPTKIHWNIPESSSLDGVSCVWGESHELKLYI